MEKVLSLLLLFDGFTLKMEKVFLVKLKTFCCKKIVVAHKSERRSTTVSRSVKEPLFPVISTSTAVCLNVHSTHSQTQRWVHMCIIPSYTHTHTHTHTHAHTHTHTPQCTFSESGMFNDVAHIRTITAWASSRTDIRVFFPVISTV